MGFGLDGIAFWRQLCAVPADDAALPSGARLFANALSQPKRWGKRRLDLVTLFHIQPFVQNRRLVEQPAFIGRGQEILASGTRLRKVASPKQVLHGLWTQRERLLAIFFHPEGLLRTCESDQSA